MIRVFFISKMRRHCLIHKLWGRMMMERLTCEGRYACLTSSFLSLACHRKGYVQVNPLICFAGILLSCIARCMI